MRTPRPFPSPAMSLVLFTLLVGGCQATGPSSEARAPVASDIGFPIADFAWSAQPGTAAIDGSASLSGPDGTRQTCAGLEVVLSPKTAYTDALIARSRSRADIWQEVRWHADYDRFRRKTVCAGNGSFSFESLPEGTWYVLVPVFWETSADRMSVYRGSYLHKEVSARAGARAKVSLGDHDRF